MWLSANVPDLVAAGKGRVRHHAFEHLLDGGERDRADGHQVDEHRNGDDKRDLQRRAAHAQDQIGDQQHQRQQPQRRLRLREQQEERGRRDDREAVHAIGDAGDEDPDEDQHHHGGAGAVLVTEGAAPVAGEIGLHHVGRLMDRQARTQQDAGVAQRQDDERRNRQQTCKVLAVQRQQQQRHRVADREHREQQPAPGEVRMGGEHDRHRKPRQGEHQRQRHRDQGGARMPEQQERAERCRDAERHDLVERIAVADRLQHPRIAEIRERRHRDPDQQEVRQEQDVAQRAVEIARALGPRLRRQRLGGHDGQARLAAGSTSRSDAVRRCTVNRSTASAGRRSLTTVLSIQAVGGTRRRSKPGRKQTA